MAERRVRLNGNELLYAISTLEYKSQSQSILSHHGKYKKFNEVTSLALLTERLVYSRLWSKFCLKLVYRPIRSRDKVFSQYLDCLYTKCRQKCLSLSPILDERLYTKYTVPYRLFSRHYKETFETKFTKKKV